MEYVCHYTSPLGNIAIASDGENITGLWFEGQNHFPDLSGAREQPLAAFDEARRWLDTYFSGEDPGFTPPLRPRGTPFQRAVWRRLMAIPRGQTAAYGDIAAQLPGASPRAVGSAVARNPVALIIPCHRVVGRNGSLTGYAGGVWRKGWLLEMERGAGRVES